MKVGDRASLQRTFAVQDVEAFNTLCGPTNAAMVPEPLIGALWSCLLGVHLPGIGTMYLKQQTRFIRAASIGENLVATVEVTRIRPEKKLADLSTSCVGADGRLVAEGRALVYIGFVEGALQ